MADTTQYLKFQRVTTLPFTNAYLTTLPYPTPYYSNVDLTTMYLHSPGDINNNFSIYVSGQDTAVLRIAEYPQITNLTATPLDTGALSISATVSYIMGLNYDRFSMVFYYSEGVTGYWVAVDETIVALNGLTYTCILYPLKPNTNYYIKCTYTDSSDSHFRIDSLLNLPTVTLGSETDTDSSFYFAGPTLTANEFVTNSTYSLQGNGNNDILFTNVIAPVADPAIVKTVDMNQQLGQGNFTSINVETLLAIKKLNVVPADTSKQVYGVPTGLPVYAVPNATINLNLEDNTNVTGTISSVGTSNLNIPGGSIYNPYYSGYNSTPILNNAATYTNTTIPGLSNLLISTIIRTDKKAYAFGGLNASNKTYTNNVYSININTTTDTLDPAGWVLESTMTTPWSNYYLKSYIIVNSVVYVFGGDYSTNPGYYNDFYIYKNQNCDNNIYSAPVNADGTIGSFTLLATLTTNNTGNAAAMTATTPVYNSKNNKIYYFFYANGYNTSDQNIYYTTYDITNNVFTDGSVPFTSNQLPLRVRDSGNSFENNFYMVGDYVISVQSLYSNVGTGQYMLCTVMKFTSADLPVIVGDYNLGQTNNLIHAENSCNYKSIYSDNNTIILSNGNIITINYVDGKPALLDRNLFQKYFSFVLGTTTYKGYYNTYQVIPTLITKSNLYFLNCPNTYRMGGYSSNIPVNNVIATQNFNSWFGTGYTQYGVGSFTLSVPLTVDAVSVNEAGYSAVVSSGTSSSSLTSTILTNPTLTKTSSGYYHYVYDPTPITGTVFNVELSLPSDTAMLMLSGVVSSK